MSIRWIPLPTHTAQVDERMEVLWSDYYGAALVGDEGEIVRLSHKGCRLEVVATAESPHREVNLVLPGQVIRYKGSFCLMDRFELPSGTTVGVWHLVGFTLRLVSDAITPVPSEDGGTHLGWRATRPSADQRSRGPEDPSEALIGPRSDP